MTANTRALRPSSCLQPGIHLTDAQTATLKGAVGGRGALHPGADRVRFLGTAGIRAQMGPMSLIWAAALPSVAGGPGPDFIWSFIQQLAKQVISAECDLFWNDITQAEEGQGFPADVGLLRKQQ